MNNRKGAPGNSKSRPVAPRPPLNHPLRCRVLQRSSPRPRLSTTPWLPLGPRSPRSARSAPAPRSSLASAPRPSLVRPPPHDPLHFGISLPSPASPPESYTHHLGAPTMLTHSAGAALAAAVQGARWRQPGQSDRKGQHPAARVRAVPHHLSAKVHPAVLGVQGRAYRLRRAVGAHPDPHVPPRPHQLPVQAGCGHHRGRFPHAREAFRGERERGARVVASSAASPWC